MDIIKILTSSIEALPRGDYSPGLDAILRHVTVAFRHYDGGVDPHSDRFTDAIYRTNQAYEGSLKEAYRVLAGKDPASKSPHQIEKYLEDNKVLRQRVLTQITRYRQDYRNPSTHDHKLDFDQNEALLAIFATCGFAKLLLDQIAEKLAFDAAKEGAHPDVQNIALRADNVQDAALTAAKLVKDYINDNRGPQSGLSLQGALSGLLYSAGFKVNNEKETFLDDYWDIFLTVGNFDIPVEVRSFGQKFDHENSHGLDYLLTCVEEGDYLAGINVIGVNGSQTPADIYIAEIGEITIYVVSSYSLEEISKISRRNIKFSKYC